MNKTCPHCGKEIGKVEKLTSKDGFRVNDQVRTDHPITEVGQFNGTIISLNCKSYKGKELCVLVRPDGFKDGEPLGSIQVLTRYLTKL